MIASVSRLQLIMSFVVLLAVVIVAGVKCSNHETAESRAMHSHEEGPMRIKAQSRISMLKGGNNNNNNNGPGGYGARVQIREDLHGRKHAHAMAICDCNGQGPWRPLFKPSQILKTEFPEHEAFHEEVDAQYRSLVSEQVDNQLRALQSSSQPSSASLSSSSPSAEHLASGSDSSSGGGSFSGGVGGFSGGFSGGGGSFSGGGGGGGGGGDGRLGKKHNHMIHLHLIPHIYVPIVHSSGFSEAKNYHASVEEGTSPNHSIDSSSEFQAIDGAGGGSSGPSSPGESSSAVSAPLAATSAGDATENDHGGGGGGGGGNFNGHSGETSYYTITEDAVQHLHHDLNDNYNNAIDNGNGNNHDYEAPSNPAPSAEEPHQYQVHEFDDLSKDYSNKKHTMTVSATVSKSQKQQQQQQQQLQQQQQQQQQQQKLRNAAVKANRAKHGRKLTSRQDLKNLLVMRPPPVGQSQTWRYVYHPAMSRHHQFYQRKPPLMPVIKTRTVPLILHIRQRSDDRRR